MKKIFCLLCISVISFLFSFSQSIGAGLEGSPNISGIVNIYTAVTQNIFSCDNEIFVESTAGFQKEDLILVIQMQGTQIDGSNNSNYGTITDYGNAGEYAYGKIFDVTASSLVLYYPLLRGFDVTGKVQVVRVPQYVSPIVNGTLTCKPWDGETGGVLALDAFIKLTMNADIDVSRKGFRGGVVIDGDDYYSDTIYYDNTPSLKGNAPKGEGIAGYGIDPNTSARGAPANGGGGGNSHTAGGGGGGNFGCGGNGGWGYPLDTLYKKAQGIGGYLLSYSNAENKIFPGGGGGAGYSHENEGTNGGNGGGIVLVTATEVEGNNNFIFSKGDSSIGSTNPVHADGIGGGGAGGTIILAVTNFSSNISVDVSGGNGGNTPNLGAGPGGGGGGGMVWFSSAVIPGNVTINSVAGGIGGKANTMNWGAVDGCNGGTLFNFSIPFNKTVTAVTADFNFSPSDINSNTAVAFTNQSINATSYQWDFGDGDNSIEINPSHDYSSGGNFTVTLIASNGVCSDTISKIISVKNFSFFVPNAFTPNGDGVNDEFKIIGAGTNKFTLRIYNRWGQEVFKSSDINAGWNGKFKGIEQPIGVYAYYVQGKFGDGKEFLEKGNITLLR